MHLKDNLHTKYFLILVTLFLSVTFTAAQDNLTFFKSKVDSLVNDAIDSMAFPGAQVLVIYKGKTVLEKSYGHHTYEKKVEVENHHLYDLASVTKIMAGGLSLMKLQEQNMFHPDLTIDETFSFLKRSNKNGITWRSILAHQAGMEPYIVFWQKMKRKNGKYRWRTFSSKFNKRYPIQIDDQISLHRRYPKLMKKAIKKSPLGENKYRYSGLSFLLIPTLVEERSDLPLDRFLKKHYFDRMQLDRITFKPKERFPISEIVPTEIDTFFRHTLVHGHVHDENAAMLNGISANAGLFANAKSLGEIGKMLINKGLYRGQQMITQEIIDDYTSVQFPENDNRRGLTFDKPPLDVSEARYISKHASPNSFGHSGFTGTLMWIDPDSNLILVFLSNRVHPYRSHRKLYESDFRPKLHDLCYEYVTSEAKSNKD